MTTRALAAAALLLGCAHGRDRIGEPLERQAWESVVVEEVAAPTKSAPPARPRLSRTVTLGQGAEPTYVPSRPPEEAPATQNVVVNQQVIVQAPSAYGAPYGGYAYVPSARWGATYEGRPAGARPAPQRWGATGWEGARRTAAPGQTPGVGGNWAPPPSYGPATMK